METEHKFGVWYSAAYLVNWSVGTGFLLMPWAYQRAGLLLGVINQVIVGFGLYLIGRLILGIMSRSVVLAKLQEIGQRPEPLSPKHLFFKGTDGEEYQPILEEAAPTPDPEITDDRIDYWELINLIYGRKMYLGYLVLYQLVMFSALATYVMIFSSSFAANVPINSYGTCNVYKDETYECRLAYTWWGLIFVMGMTLLCMLGFEEQRVFQVVMFFGRIIVFIMFFVCAVHLIIIEKEIDSDDKDFKGDQPLAIFKDLGMIIPIAWSASVFSTNLPEIATAAKNRTSVLPTALLVASVLLSVLYSGMGVLMGLAVDDITEIANIEFEDYTGGQADRHWWAYLVSYIIVLFPALDLWSIFPLLAINNADHIQSLIWGINPSDWTRTSYYVSRISAILPAFCVGLAITGFAADLAIITGILWLIMIPVFVPILSLESKRLVPKESAYDLKYGGNWVEVVLLFYAVVCVGVTIAFDIDYFIIS